MKNNQTKGFNILSLIISIVIIGLITGGLLMYFNNQKRRNYVTMANQYITDLRLLATEEKIILPETRDIEVLISVSRINTNKELTESPFGENWVLDKSYIIIKNEGTEYNPVYNYYIALEDEGGNCIELTRETNLKRENVTKGCNIEEHAETNAVYME